MQQNTAVIAVGPRDKVPSDMDEKIRGNERESQPPTSKDRKHSFLELIVPDINTNK